MGKNPNKKDPWLTFGGGSRVTKEKKNKKKKKDIFISQEEVEAQAAEVAWMQDEGYSKNLI